MFESSSFDNHERVVFAHDATTGLRAIVAIHSTARGPAAGGSRIWQYDSSNNALTDALRLSRGMSYKNAMAGLPLGGGKSVVMVDSERPKTPAMMAAFGRFVDSLHGQYITAEDVGATVADMEIVATQTRYVSGLPRTAVSSDGKPGPKTALGVYLGIKAAVKFRLKKDELRGLTIAVQGLGGVGYELCKLLAKDGAKLRVADVRESVAQRVAAEFDAIVCLPEQILFERADVVSPCALGAILDAHTIPKLQTSIVAGAANNQLATAQDGARLHSAGVLYAPDYVINAGGIISVGREYLGGATVESITAEIQRIPARLSEIFTRSRASNHPTSDIADDMARQLLSEAR